MSVIVYGPQGCGKTQWAERLRRFFKMDEICDDEMDPYPLTKEQVIEFKNGSTLFLTSVDPKSKGYTSHGEDGNRRVLSFERAMKLLENR